MKLTMNDRGRLMTSSADRPIISRRAEAVLTRGPGRLVTRELNEFLDANPGEVVELDFGTHILRIEKIVPGQTE